MNTGLKNMEMPQYTKGEEIFNMVSHIVGVALGVTVTTLCVITAARHHNVYGIVSGALFGFMMIVVYCMSSIYHGLKPNIPSKKVLRVLDHCAIYLLIAATYTPFALCIIRESNPALGWVHFGIVWGVAAIGITLNAISLKKFKIISMILYLSMGWSLFLAYKIIFSGIGIPGLIFLVGGGVAYTVGAVLYGIGKKRIYMHSVFHLFILLGSLLHFFCIVFYVL